MPTRLSLPSASCVVLPAPRARPRHAPLLATAAPAATDFDVLITGGRIVDGTGAPWFEGDVGIVGDRITAIGRLGRPPATTRIDAANLRRARLHRHARASRSSTSWSTAAPPARSRRASRPRSPARGARSRRSTIALAPRRKPQFDRFKVTLDFRTLGEYFARLETRSRRPSTSARFVGAGGLRAYVIGDGSAWPPPEELERMKTLVRAGDAAGRAGRQHVAAVRAGPLRQHRGDRRAGEGRRRVRRPLS